MPNSPTLCVHKVEKSWASPPDWVLALAQECDRTSQRKTADLVGYSAATINLVLNCTYSGDLQKVEDKVRGALFGDSVECPILGPLKLNECRDNQARKFEVTSSHATRLYNKCRNGCPHSSLEADR